MGLGRGRLGRSKCLGATDQLWGKLVRAGGGGWGGGGLFMRAQGIGGVGAGRVSENGTRARKEQAGES